MRRRRYRLYITALEEARLSTMEWSNDTHGFDEDGFVSSLSPDVAHFFREFFLRTQLFEVFVTDRLNYAAQGYPAKGVFEREVAELLGNLEMFGDAAPGPFTSNALPYSQTFRSVLGFRVGGSNSGRNASGARASTRDESQPVVTRIVRAVSRMVQ